MSARRRGSTEAPPIQNNPRRGSAIRTRALSTTTAAITKTIKTDTTDESTNSKKQRNGKKMSEVPKTKTHQPPPTLDAAVAETTRTGTQQRSYVSSSTPSSATATAGTRFLKTKNESLKVKTKELAPITTGRDRKATYPYVPQGSLRKYPSNRANSLRHQSSYKSQASFRSQRSFRGGGDQPPSSRRSRKDSAFLRVAVKAGIGSECISVFMRYTKLIYYPFTVVVLWCVDVLMC